MLTALFSFLAVLPVFALVLAGYLAGRLHILEAYSSESLNRFVVWLALPAMLFQTVALADWADLWQPGFIAAFGLSGIVVLLLAIGVAWRTHGRLIDAAIEGLNAGYPNVGYMGFPIVISLLGAGALLLPTIATMMTMCVFFAIAIVLAEIGQHAGGGFLRVLRKVAGSLIRHPLIVAPLAGVPFAWSDTSLPAQLTQFLGLLSAAAAPCALVALGLFLARKREQPTGERGTSIVFLLACKLLLQPLLAWYLAARVFDLDATQVQAVVLLAALPAGTGSFMLADYYKRDGRVSAQVIFWSTLASVGTLSAIMVLLR